MAISTSKLKLWRRSGQTDTLARQRATTCAQTCGLRLLVATRSSPSSTCAPSARASTPRRRYCGGGRCAEGSAASSAAAAACSSEAAPGPCSSGASRAAWPPWPSARSSAIGASCARPTRRRHTPRCATPPRTTTHPPTSPLLLHEISAATFTRTVLTVLTLSILYPCQGARPLPQDAGLLQHQGLRRPLSG